MSRASSSRRRQQADGQIEIGIVGEPNRNHIYTLTYPASDTAYRACERM